MKKNTLFIDQSAFSNFALYVIIELKNGYNASHLNENEKQAVIIGKCSLKSGQKDMKLSWRGLNLSAWKEKQLEGPFHRGDKTTFQEYPTGSVSIFP